MLRQLRTCSCLVSRNAGQNHNTLQLVWLRITAAGVPYPSDIWYKCSKFIEKCEGKFELNFVNMFIYHWMLSVDILQHKKKYWYWKVTYVNIDAAYWVCFLSNDTYEAQVSQLWNSLVLSEYHNTIIWKVWDQRDLCCLVSVLKR